MNKEAALASLGLTGQEDTAAVARVYGERLTVVQEQLISAQTDADRHQCRTKMSQLVEAYELVTSTGRYKDPAGGEGGATVVRATLTEAAPPPHPDTFVRMEPGAVLSSRHEIGALLGQGGMGSVYAARDRLKDEDVAIKVLRQDLLFSVAAKDRFLAEAKVSCSLSHPNIVRVHDVGVSGDLYYFSMERLKGHTLRQRMEAYRREGRDFPVAEVTDIAKQLIDALRYAHRYIVHRDLKPENVWLAEDGTVKLMDFGIARAFSHSQLTQTGMALGTAYYMAPEQRVAAKEVDWRADQYALGVVLYELLAGTLPTGAVRSLEKVRRDVPVRYAHALMRAMAAKPDERFPSLNALLAEVEAPDRKMVGAGKWLLLGLGLAAAAAGAFVVLNKQTPTPAPAAQVAAATPAVEKEVASASATGDPVAAQPPSDGTPPVEPPSSDVPEKSAAAVVPETTQSEADAMPPLPPPAETKAAAVVHEKPAQRVAAIDQSRGDSRRQQCVTQCERDEAECRSINRRGKQDCMRAVAFSSSGRLTTTNPAAASCAFYGRDRCGSAIHRDACLSRMTTRYQSCVELLGGSIASKRADCEDNARGSDKLCLDELRDCRASCE